MSVQYGQGASFQAACPAAPPPPAGYTSWSTALHGPVDASVVAVATTMANDMTLPLGASQTVYLADGTAVIVRVDPHTMSGGVPGCYHGASAYLPTGAVVTPPGQTQGIKVMEVLLGASVIVSLVLGIRQLLPKKRRK